MNKGIVTLTSILLGLSLSACKEKTLKANEAYSVVPVAIEETNGRYQLLRGGKPYEIKGAGLSLSTASIESLHESGGNSLRTWSTYPGTDRAQVMLDRAHELGMTVSLGLPVAAPRWGFDYNDPERVKKQFEKVKAEVIKYKDHPALLMWIIGNELEHNAPDYNFYNAVNDIALMIDELDPHHPTTTTFAGLNAKALEAATEKATALDFISFQVYGQINILPEFIEQQNYTRPFMVTEWGAIGYWEVAQTEWGAPIEMNSSSKAENYRQGYEVRFEAVKDQLLGNYVFLWGQKQERTPTWFGLFTEKGEKTEAHDVMHLLWKGEWPANRSPSLEKMTLDGKTASENIRLQSDSEYSASVSSRDPDGDKLLYRWELKPESDSEKEGGDYEKAIASMNQYIENPSLGSIKFKTPKEPGPYRLFVYINDGKDHVAHANIPFYVE